MSGRIAIPGEGLHKGVPFREYLAWDAASNSRLGKLLRSAAHLKRDLEAEDSDSKAKRIGRATHAALLEPGIFGEVYVTANGCDFVTGSGALCSNSGKYLLADGRWACGTHVKGFEDAVLDDVVVLSDEENERVEGAREAVLAHPYARELLEAEGESELSGLWTDERTEVLCKLRADRVLRGRGIAVDLKTTRDASFPEFERDAWKRGYYRQAALYLAGLQALGEDVGHFTIVAVESEPPHGVIVYRVTEGALDAGEEELMLLLDIYARTAARDEWPGYEDRIRDLSLPPWAWTRVDDRLGLLRRRLAALN